MKHRLSGGQQAVLEAIRCEVASGKSVKEAVRKVMTSKQFNHMTVKRVAQKLIAIPELWSDD
jgi:Xaa-Pro aminopeptidase